MTGATHINDFSGKKVVMLKEFDATYRADGNVEVIRCIEYMRDDHIYQKPVYVFLQTYSQLK